MWKPRGDLGEFSPSLSGLDRLYDYVESCRRYWEGLRVGLSVLNHTKEWLGCVNAERRCYKVACKVNEAWHKSALSYFRALPDPHAALLKIPAVPATLWVHWGDWKLIHLQNLRQSWLWSPYILENQMNWFTQLVYGYRSLINCSNNPMSYER